MYTSVIPPIKEQIPLSRTYKVLSKQENDMISNQKSNSSNVNSARRIDQIPEESEPSNSQSVTPNLKDAEKEENNLMSLKRSTSANSILKIRSSSQPYNSSLNYYNKAIEYLKEQYKQTLDKLHNEVSDLKSENQKLNFRLLVENEGNIEDIINDSLSKPLKNMRLRSNTNIVNSNIPNDVLLNETIRDLKVKLRMSEDSNKHLNSTIRNLTKKLNLLKRLGETAQNMSGPRTELINSNTIVQSPGSKASSRRSSLNKIGSPNNIDRSNVSNNRFGDLQLGFQQNENNNIPKNASISLSLKGRKTASNKPSNSSIRMNNLHFPAPPSPKSKPESYNSNLSLRSNNFSARNSSSSANKSVLKNKEIIAERDIMSGNATTKNKFEKLINDKDDIIDQLSQENTLQKSRINELELVLENLKKSVLSDYENVKIGDHTRSPNTKITEQKTILRSGSSKQTLQLLPPISNQFHGFVGNTSNSGNSAQCSEWTFFDKL